MLDAVASETGYVGSGYLDPCLTNAGLKAVCRHRTGEHARGRRTEFADRGS